MKSWGRGNHNQNILSEKIYLQQKRNTLSFVQWKVLCVCMFDVCCGGGVPKKFQKSRRE